MSEKLPLRTFGGNEEDSPYYGLEQRDYGEDVAKQIDDEVRTLIDNAHETARKILLENRIRLIYLAEKLFVVENLEGPELEKIFTEPISPDDMEKQAADSKKTHAPPPPVGMPQPTA